MVQYIGMTVDTRITAEDILCLVSTNSIKEKKNQMIFLLIILVSRINIYTLNYINHWFRSPEFVNSLMVGAMPYLVNS